MKMSQKSRQVVVSKMFCVYSYLGKTSCLTFFNRVETGKIASYLEMGIVCFFYARVMELFNQCRNIHPRKVTAGYPKGWALEKVSPASNMAIFGLNSLDFWRVYVE